MPELSAPSRNDSVTYSAKVVRILHRIVRRGVAEEAVADAEQRRDDDGEHRDRLVLAREVRLGALLNGVGDLLHLRRAAAAREHPSGEEDREQERDGAGADDDA